MSLNKESFYDNNKYEITESEMCIEGSVYKDPVFFFIYNFDNYYHFLYDTLPYLYTYLFLKNKIPELKLLINYPNKFKKEFYRFNMEFLEKIVSKDDILLYHEEHIYSKIFISSSLTHGGFSNNPPRPEINEIFDIIKSKIVLNIKTPELIYISRRTWINNDKTNIGTDYTTRRKMMNEDLLVEKLTQLGFIEIFAENLTTDEKIKIFSNAKIIVGSIGGGMSNLVFSNKNTKSFVLVTPYFLDINYIFKYSMESSDITYYNDIYTYKENNTIPLYCRAKIINKESIYYNKIGEIVEFTNQKYKLNISNNDVVGFNNLIKYEEDYFDYTELELLDNGLNSPYTVNLTNLLSIISNNL
jgi:capsular polysaccharide biosynthesis protein